MNLRKMLLLIFLIQLVFCFQSCISDNSESSNLAIVSTALSDSESPFFVNPGLYSLKQETMPIGIFDSGTGGLAVLETILTLDEFNNETNQPGSDSIPDFISESFIYLADEANMPYGRYDAEGKTDFLRELVLKDVIFLTGNKFYTSPEDKLPQYTKSPVKEIVIACNTATAYGLETVKESAREWDLPVKITGIIEAGADDAINTIENENISSPLVAVLATEGTCSSNGYPNTIYRIADAKLPGSDLKVIQQPGIGLAGSIDGDINYVDPDAGEVRTGSEYFGPGLNSNKHEINPSLYKAYNFETGNKLLVEKNLSGDTTEIQLNSVSNYVRYMVTGLVHQALLDFPERSIDIVILGCTHYPYVMDEIREHFNYLDLIPLYSEIIPDSIIFIDPSKALAISLYKNLVKNNILGNNSMEDSEFYISVPNTQLEVNRVDTNMEFPFEWKYGRDIDTEKQYVKIVPFSDRWIDPEVRERIRVSLPATYNLLK